ncbi:glycosyltransferase family 4 protein [Lysobacter soyae]|uniref:Glycosyltransferase family 4 protein n=2 Tax=Lysobacter soyae TaxID=2764185 RepID=A0ABX8WT40_9GAMM|nr:glycosyltransferase family 4 protein [Lysobacter sp. CJ11]
MQACQTDSRDRGIGRYAFSLVSAMLEMGFRDIHTTLLLDGVEEHRLGELRRKLRAREVGAKTATYSYPSSASFTDLHRELRESAALLKARTAEALESDVILCTSFFEVGERFTAELSTDRSVAKAVIAYDLIPLSFPEMYLPEGEFISTWYREKVGLLADFDLFLAISEATKRDLIEHLGVDEAKIVVIGAGLDVHLASVEGIDEDDVLGKFGIDRPFVLMVGNADWRKNCIGALEAFSMLPADVRDTHQLVFTRVGTDVTDALKAEHSSLKDSVVVAGQVSEEELATLYKRCAVFYFPSHYEGFGLPILEAMAAGAPVLSSNAGALPEVIHTAEALFSPDNSSEGAELLARALSDESFRSRLKAGAIEHAHGFTWSKCATLAIEALRGLSVVQAPKATKWLPSESEISTLAAAVRHSDRDGVVELKQALSRINKKANRRILVDITEVVRLDARSGIQRVVRNFCRGLHNAATQTGHQVVPFCWTETGIMDASDFLGQERTKSNADISLNNLLRPEVNDIVFMVDSSWWLPQRFEAFHAEIRSLGGEVVWMVYDLIPIRVPETCDPQVLPAFKGWIDYAIQTADGFICISHATEADLLEYMNETLHQATPRPWTRNVHLGSDLEMGSATAGDSDRIVELKKILGASPVFLAIGTVEPRKDYETILRAFERLWSADEDVRLVLVGKQGWNIEHFAKKLRTHSELHKRLFWLESLSDEDLSSILDRSDALIQASVAEGFGLPVVEAGSLGKPLFLSDLVVFREIAECEATYFPVGNDKELSREVSASLLRRNWKVPRNIKTLTWTEASRILFSTLIEP